MQANRLVIHAFHYYYYLFIFVGIVILTLPSVGNISRLRYGDEMEWEKI